MTCLNLICTRFNQVSLRCLDKNLFVYPFRSWNWHRSVLPPFPTSYSIHQDKSKHLHGRQVDLLSPILWRLFIQQWLLMLWTLHARQIRLPLSRICCMPVQSYSVRSCRSSWYLTRYVNFHMIPSLLLWFIASLSCFSVTSSIRHLQRSGWKTSNHSTRTFTA